MLSGYCIASVGYQKANRSFAMCLRVVVDDGITYKCHENLKCMVGFWSP